MTPLYGIQVLRALAALMVVFHHIQADAAIIAARAGESFTASRLLPWPAGVDLFFVISGFIIVHSSTGLFGQPDSARLFLARRVARVFPLYWVATTLFLIALLATPGLLNSAAPGAAQIAASYLFWPMANAAGDIQPIFSLGWTLNYEMLFYSLFAVALLLPARAVIPAVTLLLAGFVAIRELAGPFPLPFDFWAQPIVLEFVAGMGIALLRGRGLRLPGPLRWLMVALALGVLLAIAGETRPQTGWSALFLQGGPAILLVTAAACGRNETAPSALVRGFAWLGDASYALYLVHPFVMRGLREVFLRLAPGATLAFTLLALAIAVSAAFLIYERFERPTTRLLRKALRA